MIETLENHIDPNSPYQNQEFKSKNSITLKNDRDRKFLEKVAPVPPIIMNIPNQEICVNSVFATDRR